MQSILLFISNLGLFKEISPLAHPLNQPRSLTLGLKANLQLAAEELGEGIHGDSRTLAARPPQGGLCLQDFL